MGGPSPAEEKPVLGVRVGPQVIRELKTPLATCPHILSAGASVRLLDQVRDRLGWLTMAACEESISTVCAPMRLAIQRSRSGLMAWSCLATRYHEGIVFYAAAVAVWSRAAMSIGSCASAMSVATAGLTSAAKTSRNRHGRCTRRCPGFRPAS